VTEGGEEGRGRKGEKSTRYRILFETFPFMSSSQKKKKTAIGGEGKKGRGKNNSGCSLMEEKLHY